MGALKRLYQFHFRNERRERLFLASVAFLITFAIVRAITLTIRLEIGPLRNVTAGGLHVHHLVWGILLLLVVSYVWLLEVGVGSSWIASLTAIAFGVGAALTLDEFALWLNLSDVYWARQGRQSIDAVLIFGGLLSAGVWGWPFFVGIARFVRHKPQTGGAYE
ncbi:MAG: hypothetical protein E6I81_13095 [Chloroflexi bacterium]|nr:MAG: hypothetical protein AUI15_37010 [Actinobacteria bacterium 13_2_20CM_2_66_6]TMD35678.1 MAG: hypothetical protein E6I89_13695 [Chloroflexota bacterium]TMD70796.1 MAG: hypothetical protein E6I81_13095 [Chloroflexota bacterium]